MSKAGFGSSFVELTRGQKITGYLPEDDGLKHALTGADVVVIPAGIPRTYMNEESPNRGWARGLTCNRKAWHDPR